LTTSRHRAVREEGGRFRSLPAHELTPRVGPSDFTDGGSNRRISVLLA
jgi:hypothetical protein